MENFRWKSYSCRPIYDICREVEYELHDTGKLKVCEKDTTFLQFTRSETAVLLLTDLIKDCDDDLLFFVAGIYLLN